MYKFEVDSFRKEGGWHVFQVNTYGGELKTVYTFPEYTNEDEGNYVYCGIIQRDGDKCTVRVPAEGTSYVPLDMRSDMLVEVDA